MFVAVIVAAGMVMSAWAVKPTIYQDCFRVVPGQLPHLVCTVEGLEGIDYAVDKYASNDWEVVIHGWGMDDSRIKKAKPGEHLLDDNNFIKGIHEVAGTAQPFVFEFCNWYRDGAAGSKTWYGYVSIALDERGSLVILESAICDQQNVLTVTGYADNPNTGNNRLVVDDRMYIVFAQSPKIVGFYAVKRSSGEWDFGVAGSSGPTYVAEGVVNEPVCDETFSNHWVHVEGTGNVFRAAFKWQSKDGASSLYGWMTLQMVDGVLTIMAQEVADTPNVAVVGRNDPTTIPPDDIENLDGIIWQCDFKEARELDSLYSIPGLDGHLVFGGDIQCWTLTNHIGRACASFDGYKPCMMVWFSLNKTGHFSLGNYSDYQSVGDFSAPKLWESTGIAFRLWADNPAVEGQSQYSELPLYGTTWFNDLYARSEQMPNSSPTFGPVINIDDKMSLRYFLYESGDGACRTNWQLNTGVMDASSNLVERTVELSSADPKKSLPSAVGRWTAIRVEAENDASALGLAFRIYIDGVPAASAEDGQTIFRARPAAVNRTGIAALGLGGRGYVDDVTFFSKSRNPMEGIDIPDYQQFSAEETATIAAIVGEDALYGVRGLYLRDYDGEPDGTYRTCVQLGITPKEIDGDVYKTLTFTSPTVSIVGFDPVSRTVTGRIIPAEGTRIAAPPMPYMFGLTEIDNFGTEWQGRTEYGYECVQGNDGFAVDLTNYLSSNGVFRIRFPEYFLGKESKFFSITVKPYDR